MLKKLKMVLLMGDGELEIDYKLFRVSALFTSPNTTPIPKMTNFKFCLL